MGHRNLQACVADLERHGHLVRVDHPVDPNLELAAIQRRLYRKRSPAVLFTRPKNTAFPMLANLFGTMERTRFLFRDALEDVRKLVELKSDPQSLRRRPMRYWDVPLTLLRLRPRFVRSGPILANRIPLAQLPQLKSWPLDGGAFVTLPAVYTEDPDRPGWQKSNIGMYRVQLAGNDFDPVTEVGMHYQIHRGIGVHHAAAVRRGEPLRVNVIVGGPPALAVAAVMPLPEGLPELAFAAALGGRRIDMVQGKNSGFSPSPWEGGGRGGGRFSGELSTPHPNPPPQGGRGPEKSGLTLPLPAEADFVISGTVHPTDTKPEGPFGDHLGYYSLTHPFPVMKVDAVYHRPGAIWPFTVVGRPPQEDTSFGEFIHELTGPVIPSVLPGVKAIHAVDAAGVHPLLLAIGSERYVPYSGERRPQELLTTANAILGQGQLSLAKFLFLAAHEDDPALDIHDIRAFFRHVLERLDPANDLHFHTRTTIDTLDYSAGEGLNAGSKLVVAVAGKKRRELASTVPDGWRFPSGFANPRMVMPGIVAVSGPPATSHGDDVCPEMRRFLASLEGTPSGVPVVVLVDDSDFAAAALDNFLWVTFTRANPAADVHGVGAGTFRKHWGCRGPVVIDARLKPHMPPPLTEDPDVTRRVNELAARGGPLYGLID